MADTEPAGTAASARPMNGAGVPSTRPSPFDLLNDPRMRESFEQKSAALEAAELVRQMRRQASSVSGTRGMSQRELAERVGVSQPRISEIERGEGRDGISYALLRKVAYACGIDWRQRLIAALGSGTAEQTSSEASHAATTTMAAQAEGVLVCLADAADGPRQASRLLRGRAVVPAAGHPAELVGPGVVYQPARPTVNEAESGSRGVIRSANDPAMDE